VALSIVEDSYISIKWSWTSVEWKKPE